MSLVVRNEGFAKGAPRLGLEPCVDCRRYREATQTSLLRLESVENALGELDCFGCQSTRSIARWCKSHGLVLRGGPLPVVKEALAMHLVEHVGAADERCAQIRPRMKLARVGDTARDERCLSHGQVLGTLAKIVPSRLLDAVPSSTQEDVVQVEFENLVLRETPLESSRQKSLANLSGERAFLSVQKEILDDLLGNRRASLARGSGPKVHEECSGDSPIVEPFVLVKPRVFGGEDGELHMGGQRANGYERSSLREQLGQ